MTSIFLYTFIVFIITILIVFIIGKVNINEPDYEKLSAYECGFDPFEDSRSAFDVRFYLVAIFFIIFDLEIIFFFPLVIVASYLSYFLMFFFFLFSFFLVLGFVYEVSYGTLDWS